MVVSLTTFLLAVGVTQVILFVLLALLYSNPFIAKYYNKHRQHPSMKPTTSQGTWMLNMFIFQLFEVLLAGLLFFIVANAIPGSGWWKGLVFGLLLTGVRIYPRFVNIFMMINYPKSLMTIEFINGTIGCVVMGLCFAYFL